MEHPKIVPWQAFISRPISKPAQFFCFGALWLTCGVTILVAHHGVSKFVAPFVVLGSAFVFLGGSEKLLEGSYFRWMTRALTLLFIGAAIYLSSAL